MQYHLHISFAVRTNRADVPEHQAFHLGRSRPDPDCGDRGSGTAPPSKAPTVAPVSGAVAPGREKADGGAAWEVRHGREPLVVAGERSIRVAHDHRYLRG
jgi:hypothetical protein